MAVSALFVLSRQRVCEAEQKRRRQIRRGCRLSYPDFDVATTRTPTPCRERRHSAEPPCLRCQREEGVRVERLHRLRQRLPQPRGSIGGDEGERALCCDACLADGRGEWVE